jgi:hypothetical protein
MADATDDEYPHKEWAEWLYKGWLVVKNESEASILDAMTNESISDNTVSIVLSST